MVKELWGNAERQAMNEFKKEIKNGALPDKQFNTVEEGMAWMSKIRSNLNQPAV